MTKPTKPRFPKDFFELKEFKCTEDPEIFVNCLPKFTRANKFIGTYSVCVVDGRVPDGTMVIIKAFSEKTGWGQMKNNTAVLRDGLACFQDLRFIGKSGRNTFFDIYYYFVGFDFYVTYKSAIKVTVDGPRPKRIVKSKQLGSFDCKSMSERKRERIISEVLNESECESNNDCSGASCSPNSSFASFMSSPSHHSFSDSYDMLKSELHSPKQLQTSESMHIVNQSTQKPHIDRELFTKMYCSFRQYPETQLVPLFQQNQVFSLLYPMFKSMLEQQAFKQF